jgi:hypothetical protein
VIAGTEKIPDATVPAGQQLHGVLDVDVRREHDDGRREDPWGRAEFDCPSRLASGGASVIGGAVARRDGRQVLRFGRVKQPSVVDAEGCEAVPMGVRSRQVYRI